MTPNRRKEWEGKLFHNLKSRVEEVKTVFDINLFEGISPDDIDFQPSCSIGVMYMNIAAAKQMNDI